ncbi:MAG: MTH1187 family thiamine-binding protein [Gammaproteobacteria bacterium]|nr:MTH1187 family thiamine-binding protein [Gammaproteobacteria bacterium]
MHAIVGFTLVPVGSGVSVSPYIAALERVLEKSGLTFELNANSTNIEGEWDRVFAVLRQCHEVVHGEGAPRIHTTIQVGTRTDKEQTMADKLKSVIKRRPLQTA